MVPLPAEELARAAALQRDGRLAEAAALHRALAERFPGEHEAWFRLALALAAVERTEEALAALERAVTLEARAAYRLLRADLLERSGRDGEAIASLEELVRSAPAFAPGLARLGEKRLGEGRIAEAIALLEAAARARPQHAPTLSNLAYALLAARDFGRAETAAREALAADPGHAFAREHLGRALYGLGAFTLAEAELARAAERSPHSAPPWLALANARLLLGQASAALEAFDAALALDPPDAAAIGSARLLAMHYDDRLGRAAIFEAHRAWAERHAKAPSAGTPRGASRGARKLRIGYVSPRFHESSAATLLLPVLEAHDRERFEIFCYACSALEDGTTARLRALADDWRQAASMSDAELAASMRADAIDIAVDLAGHTPGNRLGAFAYRPAPVAATWLDYFDTTGLGAIDALITDPGHSPPGDAQPFSERLVRLPRLRFCWRPPADAPLLSPSGRRGRLVFGSFNRLAKLSPTTLAAWRDVLLAVPEAMLLLKSAVLERDDEKAALASRLSAAGIDPARVEMRGASPFPRMLEEYADVDIVLDSFPYNGGITTFEALWMGRPVVTIRGDTLISRQSAAILSSVDCADWIGADRAGFVAIAKGLAGDREALARESAVLRARLEASPPLDAIRFTRDLEAAFEALRAGKAAPA